MGTIRAQYANKFNLQSHLKMYKRSNTCILYLMHVSVFIFSLTPIILPFSWNMWNCKVPFLLFTSQNCKVKFICGLNVNLFKCTLRLFFKKQKKLLHRSPVIFLCLCVCLFTVCCSCVFFSSCAKIYLAAYSHLVFTKGKIWVMFWGYTEVILTLSHLVHRRRRKLAETGSWEIWPSCAYRSDQLLGLFLTFINAHHLHNIYPNVLN